MFSCCRRADIVSKEVAPASVRWPGKHIPGCRQASVSGVVDFSVWQLILSIPALGLIPLECAVRKWPSRDIEVMMVASIRNKIAHHTLL